MNKDPISKIVKRDAKDFAKKHSKSRSAIDQSRANESKEFSEEAQKNFGSNERGSEDVMDMYEKGAFD